MCPSDARRGVVGCRQRCRYTSCDRRVRYKGGTPVSSTWIGGQAQLTFDNTPHPLSHLTSAKIKAIGAGGDSRLSILQRPPTFAERWLPA